MALKIVVQGTVDADLLGLLERQAPDAEVEAASGSAIPGAASAHLIVLGADANPDAAVTDGDLVPVLACSPRPHADFTLPRDPSERAATVRSAIRMARLRLAAVSSAGSLAESALARIEHEFIRSTRYRHPVALLDVQPDDPERLAAEHGPEAADAYGAALSAAFRRALRSTDVVLRLTPFETVVLMIETDGSGAAIAAQRLRAQAARLLVKPPAGASRAPLPIKTTVSVGLAEAPRDSIRSGADLLECARRAVRAAREAGGDRVATAP